MERIDKIISSQTNYSRRDIKKLISNKKIKVDGIIINKSDMKVDPEETLIEIDNEKLNFKRHLYLMLNKPEGYVSSTNDNLDKTVLDLVPKSLYKKKLFPAGRLDKDTTGLMIITDDGAFAHNILSPKKHIRKIYEVTINKKVTEKMQEDFKNGINLSDGICKSADLVITGENSARVTLTEGRYHQIKRMFQKEGSEVIKLKRIAMGNLFLPISLEEGECRELTEKELDLIKEKRD